MRNISRWPYPPSWRKLSFERKGVSSLETHALDCAVDLKFQKHDIFVPPLKTSCALLKKIGHCRMISQTQMEVNKVERHLDTSSRQSPRRATSRRTQRRTMRQTEGLVVAYRLKKNSFDWKQTRVLVVLKAERCFFVVWQTYPMQSRAVVNDRDTTRTRARWRCFSATKTSLRTADRDCWFSSSSGSRRVAFRNGSFKDMIERELSVVSFLVTKMFCVSFISFEIRARILFTLLNYTTEGTQMFPRWIK